MKCLMLMTAMVAVIAVSGCGPQRADPGKVDQAVAFIKEYAAHNEPTRSVEQRPVDVMTAPKNKPTVPQAQSVTQVPPSPITPFAEKPAFAHGVNQEGRRAQERKEPDVRLRTVPAQVKESPQKVVSRPAQPSTAPASVQIEYGGGRNATIVIKMPAAPSVIRTGLRLRCGEAVYVSTPEHIPNLQVGSDTNGRIGWRPAPCSEFTYAKPFCYVSHEHSDAEVLFSTAAVPRTTATYVIYVRKSPQGLRPDEYSARESVARRYSHSPSGDRDYGTVQYSRPVQPAHRIQSSVSPYTGVNYAPYTFSWPCPTTRRNRRS